MLFFSFLEVYEKFKHAQLKISTKFMLNFVHTTLDSYLDKKD